MKTFRQHVAERRLNEAIVRKGAVASYAAQGKKHGDNAARSYNQAKLTLQAVRKTQSTDTKVDALARAFIDLLDGLVLQREQIGSVSAQITALAML
jgi:hypothetical protein